ncbi:MAG: chemotaxis response regulator protein-glutamate methylesterase [Polyangiaceae bacterium]
MTTPPVSRSMIHSSRKKVRVLIVDDSALVRQTLAEVIASDPGLEVIATASDPYQAVERIAVEVPDVITLDIEMPRMDGLTFLQKLMSQHPIPVIICSSLAEDGAETTLRALEYGAIDILQKPRVGTKQFLEESRVRVCDAIHAASRARPQRRAPAVHVEPKLTADVMLAKAKSQAMLQTTERVVAVGASTGGTEALRVFLEALPANSPGMVIVQHMPEKFTNTFAQRLNELCAVTVKEAVDGDSVVRGRVLVAPGNKHTMLKRNGARYFVEVKDGPLVCRHRPSVDVLFRSAARYVGKNAVGVIMTGMGDDGALGMLEMKEAGAITFAQDEATSVVWGMPAEAVKRGGVDKVLPLERLAPEVIRAAP